MARLIVIGASGGGIEALQRLVAALPPDFPAPVALVMHTAPQSPGVLPEILTRAGPLTAVSARNGERLRPGVIYVAPPDQHLLIEPGRARVTHGPRENRFRPAIDPLFRSAAQVYGPAAVGVILTGSLDDGTAGLWAIHKLGGITVVQDPRDALFPSMPQSAIDSVKVDHIVPLSDIAPLLVRLTAAPVEEERRMEAPEPLEIEVKIAKEQDPLRAGVERIGEPSVIACPECLGVLRQWKEDERLRYRCHTGHAYSAESLLAEIGEAIENDMWNAIRSLQEGTILIRQLAEHNAVAHGAEAAAELPARADEFERRADRSRDMISGSRIETPVE